MSIVVQVFPVADLSYGLFKTLQKLTFGPHGGCLYDDFAVRFENDDEHTLIIVASCKDEIVGWMMLDNLAVLGSKENVADIQMFVKETRRRQGIGRMLLTQAGRFCDRAYVQSSSPENSAFFRCMQNAYLQLVDNGWDQPLPPTNVQFAQEDMKSSR